MTTFSHLVDQMVKELVRPDLRMTIAGYLNASIREVHFRANSDSQAFFADNRNEDEVTVGSSLPFIWDIPSIGTFQKLESAYSPTLGVYFDEKSPNKAYRFDDTPFARFYRYRAGGRYCFAGATEGAVMQLSWYEYPKRLGYLAENSRTIVYDDVTQEYGLGPAAGGNAANQKWDLETNWLLRRWGVEVIAEGVRSKTWRRLGEQERAKMSYSAFQHGIQTIWNTEGTN